MQILSLPIAWLLDLLFADPPGLPHPVVWFGRWISFWERRFNRGSHRLVSGALLVTLSLVLLYALSAVALRLLPAGWPRLLLSAVLIFYCLAGHTLRREVRDVCVALERGLDDGRQQVARIVGRDTQELTAQEVRTAALETLAENLSDGVVAPLFWYCLLGVPGMLCYKLINTFDSMIGYRTPRYRQFGCWAAHTDDVANFLPARLTALLLIVVAWALRLSRRSLSQLVGFVWRYGPCHASPNSGWPEAALAAVLDCQFGGPHNYFGILVPKPFIGSNARELGMSDARLSLRLSLIVEIVAVALAVGVTVLLRH